MARIRGPASYRLRFIALAFVSAVYILYIALPNFGDGSTFNISTREEHTPSSYRFRLSQSSLLRKKRKQVQFPFKRYSLQAADEEKAKAIEETMKNTFWRYRMRAWGEDEIRPVSGEGRTTRNGWAASIVDTLTTMAVMGLEEEFLLELNYTIDKINFENAVDLVDPFETTIRYLGSIVSTLDLLDSPTVPTPQISPSQRTALLNQAVHLATKLAPGFDSPTGMIWPRINFTTNKGCKESEDERPVIGPARVGTNWLENKVLSRLTGDGVYERNATRAWKPLVWNKYIEEWPGLVDAPVDIMTGEPVDRHRSWGAGHDSYYEYLIKAHIMSPNDRNSQKYRDRWIQAVESTMKHLASRATPPKGQNKGALFLAQWRNGWLLNEMGHLACFSGGNFLLGGKYLDREDIVKFGLEIIDACHETYVRTQTHIGPEYFSWKPSDPDQNVSYEPEGDGQKEQLEKMGFWVTDARWMLRPETVESYFYAWRITGNKIYQEWAWDAYSSFIKASKVTYGYAEVQDVTQPAGPDNVNDQAESFWGAETLKYLYLTFSSEDVMSLDEWVFSTEAHPFKIMR